MPIIDGDHLAAYLKMASGGEDEEALFLAASAACRQVQQWCGRTFDKTGQLTRTYRPMKNGVVYIDDVYDATGLVVSVDSAFNGTYSTTLTIDTDFTLDPADGTMNGQEWPYFRLLPVYGWTFGWPFPTTRKPISVATDKWGWPTIPDDVTLATLIQGARLFKRRTSPEGVLGGFADFGVARITSRMDPDVEDLLTPYRWAGGVG